MTTGSYAPWRPEAGALAPPAGHRCATVRWRGAENDPHPPETKPPAGGKTTSAGKRENDLLSPTSGHEGLPGGEMEGVAHSVLGQYDRPSHVDLDGELAG